MPLQTTPLQFSVKERKSKTSEVILILRFLSCCGMKDLKSTLEL